MFDRPTPDELIEACDRFDAARSDPPTAAQLYESKVAANGRALAARQALAMEEEAAERLRLIALTGQDGDLAFLNRFLAEAIAARQMDLSTLGLAEHLWATTLAKVAVDQPSYGAYRIETGD